MFRHSQFKDDKLCRIRRLSPICVSAIAAAVLFSTGCDSMPTQQDFVSGVERVTNSIKSGIDRIAVRGSSSGSRKSNSALAVVSKYPLNEVPHTLMKKPVAEGRLTSGFGYRLSPTGLPLPKKHNGVDYTAPAGTPVYAAGDGTIVKQYNSRSYGNYILIEHANGFFTGYAHMQAFVDGLSVGSKVSKGEMIGNVGSTGRASGPHLHYELIYKNNFIDPLFEYSPTPAPTVPAAAV